MEMNGQLHAPSAFIHGESPQYPLDRRPGGSQSRSGRGGEEGKKSLHYLFQELNPGHTGCSLVALKYMYWFNLHLLNDAVWTAEVVIKTPTATSGKSDSQWASGCS